jgi:hypothetical protein
MYFVSNISGNSVFVTDTSDNTVDEFGKDEMKQVMLQNPDLVVKGVGISATSPREFKFKFTVYELSDTEKARLAGAKPPITKFCRLPEDAQARNHYYCGSCDSVLPNNKPARCPNCHKGIIYPSQSPSANFITDMTGTRYFFSSVNGIRNMLKDRMFKYA